MEDCERYLGLPMVGGKSKVNTFKDLWEKITNRVFGWKEKYISKARILLGSWEVGGIVDRRIGSWIVRSYII